MKASDPVCLAADWLAALSEAPSHAVPALKERFGLTAKQACEAIALARTGRLPASSAAEEMAMAEGRHG